MANKAKVRAHNDIPWNKVRKMWEGGKSYEFMAKAIDRYNPKSDDPTKPMRAIISRGLTVGFKDENGKTVTLKPREGMRAIGVGKTMHKGIKKAAKAVAHKTAKVVGKGGRKPVLGKSIAITLTEDGKFLRVELDKPKALVSFDKMLPSIENVLHAKGLQVVPAPQAAVAPAAEPAPVAEAPAPEKTTEPQAQPVAPSPELPPVKSDTEQVTPAA